MAFSASKKDEFNVGAKKGIVFDCDFASVTAGKVSTGLANVIFAAYSPYVSDKHGIVYPNYSDTGSTVSGGDVYIDGVTSNDNGYLFVIGA